MSGWSEIHARLSSPAVDEPSTHGSLETGDLLADRGLHVAKLAGGC